MPLPTVQKSYDLTPDQLEKLESEDSFLRGTAALDILNTAVKETGVVIPREYVFKNRDRKLVETAAHAVFELMGGVPKFLLWGAHNPDKFYPLWMKLAPGEQTITGGGNVVVMTNVPSSPLDDVQLTTSGFVQADVIGDE